jgi:cytidine deaminase
MKYRSLSEPDRALIAAAADVVARRYDADRHTVGAAVRGSSGKTYAAVNLESPGVDVCAEWTALGMAVSSGERALECCVAVKGSSSGKGAPRVISPCGVCRELLYFYAPRMEVIVTAPAGAPRKVRIAELLPLPYAGRRAPAK